MELHHRLHAVAGCSDFTEAPRFTCTVQPELGWMFSFTVSRPEFFTQDSLPRDRSAHGLWETDVFEVFLSEASAIGEIATSPYLEFQVSPLQQFFALRVLEPRKRFDTHAQLRVQVRSDVTQNQWNAKIIVPFETLSGRSPTEPLFGNVFAILGGPQTREYWSAFTPPQKSPDFHLPALFRKLSF